MQLEVSAQPDAGRHAAGAARLAATGGTGEGGLEEEEGRAAAAAVWVRGVRPQHWGLRDPRWLQWRQRSGSWGGGGGGGGVGGTACWLCVFPWQLPPALNTCPLPRPRNNKAVAPPSPASCCQLPSCCPPPLPPQTNPSHNAARCHSHPLLVRLLAEQSSVCRTHLGCLLDPPAPYSGQCVGAAAAGIIRHKLGLVAGSQGARAKPQQGAKGGAHNLRCTNTHTPQTM